MLGPIRDRVLHRCELGEDATVADVGAGDGLLGFGAFERVRRGRVIFVDVSAELLADCQETARRAGVEQRCDFVSARAEDLAPIDARSVDAVVLRAVLMYVADKQRAFDEFFRVLRPAGRLSLYEPVNQVAAQLNADTLFGYEAGGCEDLAGRINAVYRKAHPADSPMMDFDEVDLFRAAERAGFEPVEVESHVEGRRESLFGPMAWADWLQIAPSPLAPTFGDAITRALGPDDQQRLEQRLRPLVEAGSPARVRRAGAYLWAQKPPLDDK